MLWRWWLSDRRSTWWTVKTMLRKSFQYRYKYSVLVLVLEYTKNHAKCYVCAQRLTCSSVVCCTIPKRRLLLAVVSALVSCSRLRYYTSVFEHTRNITRDVLYTLTWHYWLTEMMMFWDTTSLCFRQDNWCYRTKLWAAKSRSGKGNESSYWWKIYNDSRPTRYIFSRLSRLFYYWFVHYLHLAYLLRWFVGWSSLQ